MSFLLPKLAELLLRLSLPLLCALAGLAQRRPGLPPAAHVDGVVVPGGHSSRTSTPIAPFPR